MTQYKLTYYNIRGRAETARLLFALAEVPFEDIRIPYESRKENGIIPPELKSKLPYGEVPILECDDGTPIISQSLAISRFLARRFGYYGSNEVDAAQIDEVLEACRDFLDAFKPLFFGKTEQNKLKGKIKLLETSVPKYLGKFNDILKNNPAGFLVGSSLTLADINLHSLVTCIGPFLNVDFLQDYTDVIDLFTKIEEIPQIKRWIQERPETFM